MNLNFVKMHGLGNDFMVVRWPEDEPVPTSEQISKLANRRTGVGFDQLLILESPIQPESRASYRVFNADGGEVEQCGNGARCLVKYLAGHPGEAFQLDSAAGPILGRLGDDGRVSIDLGVPDFDPHSLPFKADRSEEVHYVLDLGSETVTFGAVSMGNPHIVLIVDSVDAAPVGILGPQLERHPAFPNGTNVGFVQQLDQKRLRLRVFERGVGETQACGTGAAAAAAVLRQQGKTAERVELELPGGSLVVAWPGGTQPLWLTGPAETVFEGTIAL